MKTSTIAQILVAMAARIAAQELFLTSMNGSLITLSMSETGNGSASLAQKNSVSSGGTSPTWLTLDPSADDVYCLNEGDSANGTISTFSLGGGGNVASLAGNQQQQSIAGPTNSILFGRGQARRMAVAHYTGSSVTIWSTASSALQLKQTFTYSLNGKQVARPDRQDAPHPHQVLVDPTGKFLVVPDLGADLVRTFAINPTTGNVTDTNTPLVVKPGTGPRHGAFWTIKDAQGNSKTFYFLVGELDNSLTSYAVQYPANPKKPLTFKQIDTTTTYGGQPGPEGATAAEVIVSPDNKFIVVSNRADASVNFSGAAGSNGATKSDSLATYRPKKDGTLVFQGPLVAAGGSGPRSFAMNKAGDKVAVGLQMSGSVAILDRSPATGKIGKLVASMGGLGNVTFVAWAEPLGL